MINEAINPMFPKQSIPESQKNLDWYKQNIEVGLSIVVYKRDSGLRADRKEKLSNIKLFNDIVDPREIESAINPYNLSGKYPDTYKNYPIANSNLNLLFGEERKRLFNPISYVVNSDIVNSDGDVITEKFKQFITEQLLQQEFDQETTKKAIMNLDKWRKFTYQDTYERMSNQVIQFFLNTTDIKEQWSKNFEDLLIQGEEIASIDILGGNLVFERLNPLDVYTYRSKESYKIEDSDWISISRFLPIGEIIDNYHDYLSTKDRIYLEEVYMRKTSGSKLFPDGQLLSDSYTVEDTLQYLGLDGQVRDSGDQGMQTGNRDFDNEGNVRVTRVLWKGQRKIGIIEYKDKDGNLEKKYVDEKYKPQTELGEKVKWEYISEWYEGTKIGADIYVKYGPRPIQFRDPDNPSICHPGIVGNILNTNSSQSKSLMSYMKPYQLLYNFFMYRLQQDFVKYQGHIAKMNMAMKPDKMDTTQWMYYMQQFGIMFEDPFNEGMEGAATGKLAGGLGYNSGGSAQIGDHNLINMNIMMLDFLENRIADISGVTPQRKGAIANRETVGGVERSVMQSSNNTEKYFGLHDNFRLRCLRTLVETAKIAWKDKKEKKTFVLDDGTKSMLDFDGEEFKQGVYGIATTTSSDITNMVNDIKQLTPHMIQNGITIPEIIDIYKTKDPSSLQRKMEQYEEDRINRQQQSEQKQNEIQQQQIQAMQEVEAAKMEHERMLRELDNNTKLQVELLKQQGQDNSVELEKLNLSREKLVKEIEFKEKQLRETIRHNQQTESIARSKPKSTK
jgi:hypothetical protein